MKPNSRTTTQQRGFTITQMVVTLVIIAITSTAGVLAIKAARAEFRLQNNARLFATYIEKARADAIRRHAAPGHLRLGRRHRPRHPHPRGRRLQVTTTDAKSSAEAAQ